MHSSPFLFAAEFPVRRAGTEASLAEAFADYHPQDRIAIVSDSWEGGYGENAVAVLGLTALFYDAQRATGRPFYTYPSHYLLLGRAEQGIRTGVVPAPSGLAAAGRPWSNLDVWPETQWQETEMEAGGLLRSLFALHIHRVFWPESLTALGGGPRLPAYARRILGSRLKAVYLYGAAEPDWEISPSAGATQLLAATPRLFAAEVTPPERSRFRRVEPAAFLQRYADCFEPLT